MVFNLSESNSIANHFLMELRDVTIQRDRMRFRKNVERLGEIMAYEVSKHMTYAPQVCTTSLGQLSIDLLADQPVLINILRAGVPYFQGFINFFDQADAGFIGAFREETNGNDVQIKLDYTALPSIEGKDLIIIDPMLATGKSVFNTIQFLLKRGKPKHIHIVSVIASPEGVDHLTRNLTHPFSLWTCAVDETLNQQFYIVPGLGDAGDLSYGVKI